MVKNQKSKSKNIDSTYFLKLVMYLILGSLWLRIDTGSHIIPLPVGLVIGLVFATHEHFRLDRKIEYAVLLMAMFVGLWLPIGLTVAV
ncbi:MAG: hypothetical protein ABIQ89_02080 [Candidatus Saccharimonadales bacterium]